MLKGWFKKTQETVADYAQSFSERLKKIYSKNASAEEKREFLEELLIKANFGGAFTQAFLDDLYKKNPVLLTEDQVKNQLSSAVQDVIQPFCQPCDFSVLPEKPWVCLLSGTNGSGKTTMAGKIAWQCIQAGKKVLLSGGDLFRAAGDLQAKKWSERVGASFFGGLSDQHKDLSSFCFDAYAHAKKNHFDVLILDTAGRLHTQKNLMDELGKVLKTLKKQNQNAPHASWLVLDGTAGQNLMSQTDFFGKCVKINGILVSKLDGASMPGHIVNIAQKFQVPFIGFGTGEGQEDLVPASAKHLTQILFP